MPISLHGIIAFNLFYFTEKEWWSNGIRNQNDTCYDSQLICSARTTNSVQFGWALVGWYNTKLRGTTHSLSVPEIAISFSCWHAGSMRNCTALFKSTQEHVPGVSVGSSLIREHPVVLCRAFWPDLVGRAKPVKIFKVRCENFMTIA
jgi:hypothetical protein